MQDKKQLGSHFLSRSTLTLGLITLVGFGLRFYAIGAQTVWLDEAFSIWLAQQPLVDLWAWLIKIDQHPPLYYSLLHFWVLLFGDAQGTARALSALCSGLAIPVFYAAGRYLLNQRTALLAALLLALSPFQVQYAQEVRMYALLTLTVAVAFYLLMVVLFSERARQRQWPWVGLAVAQATVMLTHNTATVFFPLALNAAIGGAWLWKQWQGHVSSLPVLNAIDFERRWLRTQLLAVALWLPWSIPFVIQSVMVDREFWIGPPTVGMVYEALHNFNLAFLWPSWSPPFVAVNVLWWGLALLGVRTLRQTPARAGLLLTLFLLPIVGELLVSLRRPIFSDRTLIWVTLPYLLLVASGMMGAGEAVGARVAQWRVARRINSASDRQNLLKQVALSHIGVGIGGLAVLLALNGLALHTYFTYFEKEDWAEAAAYVADEIQPGEMILFNATWVQLPFQYYFRHYEQDVPLRGLPVDLFDRGVLEPKMTEADLPYMRNLLADQQSVWLVYSHDWYTDPDGIIPRELQAQMTLVERREFVGLQVMRFERAP
ncbi:MAG: hypothetical protein DYG89_13800 [Caldilinea sp. CFX5]|nr:hypothetical protein [Caldilinea sp. CFX5]